MLKTFYLSLTSRGRQQVAPASTLVSFQLAKENGRRKAPSRLSSAQCAPKPTSWRRRGPAARTRPLNGSSCPSRRKPFA